MPDKVEEILKEIHVMFAKCEPYHNTPDKVIVTKHEMFDLLEKLNEAIYEVLEQYEATSRSRERARIELDKQAAEVVAKSKLEADDVHAATLLYTDSMLDELTTIIEKAKENIKAEMVELMAGIKIQQEVLASNKAGVKEALTELHDSELYLEELHKNRKKAEDKRKFGSQADLLNKDDEEEPESPKANAAASIKIRIDNPGDKAGYSIPGKNTHGKKKGKKGQPVAALPAEHEEGMPYSAEEFDLDAEYEQWKAEKEAGEEPAKPEKKGILSIFGKKGN